MNALFLAIYGVYMLFVASRGNSNELVDYVGEDVKTFAPWLFAIIVIAILSEFEGTKALVKPFIGLLILNFVLRRWPTIEGEIKKLIEG